jgi:hypothetical protein
MSDAKLRRFFPYFGAKHKSIGNYPLPRFNKVVEPFAGSTSYATHYHFLDVTLVDKYPVIAGIWEYLTRADPWEVSRTKVDIMHINEVADSPKPLRDLIGFYLNIAKVRPCKSLLAAPTHGL